jgi:hypothetical protein
MTRRPQTPPQSEIQPPVGEQVQLSVNDYETLLQQGNRRSSPPPLLRGNLRRQTNNQLDSVRTRLFYNDDQE